MSSVLIFTETFDHKCKAVTFEILGKIAPAKADVVCVGKLPADQVAELAKFGAENVFQISGEALATYSPEGYATALESVIKNKNYDYVFCGATSLGKDLFPRLATIFNAGLASDVTHFTMDGGTFNGMRPFFSGKCLAKVKIEGPKPHFISIRPNSLGLPKEMNNAAGTTAEVAANTAAIRAIVKEIIKGASEKLDLTEANIIVSGGRAMKDASNFKILDDLAQVIGATVGASRAAVDSGYAPHAMQVGQTGKTVAPSLYIACGISGAIQHLAGMRTSKVIVAINNDPDAPIFSYADYGIVGDLFQIVPLLTEEFKKIL